MTTKTDLVEAIKSNTLLLNPDIKLSTLHFGYKFATENGYVNSVKLFLDDPRTDPAIDANYAIKVASKNGHTEVVKILLTNDKVDPTVLHNYPIRVAVENNKFGTLVLLLADPRTDATKPDNDAIITAIQLGHTNIIKLLINHLTIKDELTPILLSECLITASKYGHLDIVKLFYNIFPTGMDYCLRLNEILSSAVEYGQIHIVKFLLHDYRSDPTFNKSEMMNIAKEKKYMEILKLLYRANEKNSIFNNSMESVQKIKKLIDVGFIDADNIKFSLDGTKRKIIIEFDL